MRFVLIFIIFTIYSCASVTSPTGGPKDETPPLLVSSNPVDQTTNFSGKEIVLEFDERVELKNYLEEVLIAPRLSEEIEAIAKKNIVQIKLPDSLAANTTYSFSFREAIQDITEGNPAKNLKLAFSTGPVIDTAFISGTIKSLMKDENLEDISVALYPANDTTDIMNAPPLYMSYSDENGEYILTNLKTGEYRIYVLNDKNKNGVLDFQSESYGFIADTLQLDSSLINLEIPVIQNDRRDLLLQSARNSGPYFLIRYNKYISDYNLTTEPGDSLVSKFDDDHAGIKFYNTITKDSIRVFVQATDTLGYLSPIDTVMIKFPNSPRSSDKYELSISSDKILLGRNELSGKIVFNKPSMIMNKDSMTVFIDSVIQKNISDTIFHWNRTRTEATYMLSLSSLLTDSTDISKSKIIFGENSFKSVEGDSSTSKEVKLQWFKSEDSGEIEIQINNTSDSFIVQLLDNRFQLIKSITNERKFSFKELNPGKYIIRVLVDKNGDGTWSPGNIREGIEPEPVIIYRKTDGSYELDLKANWILGPHEIMWN